MLKQAADGRFCPERVFVQVIAPTAFPFISVQRRQRFREGESLSRSYYGQGDRKTPINARTGNYEYREEVWELSTFALLFREFVVLVGLQAAGKAKHPFFQGFAHPGEYVPASFLQSFLGRFGKCIEDGMRALTQCRGRSQ